MSHLTHIRTQIKNPIVLQQVLEEMIEQHLMEFSQEPIWKPTPIFMTLLATVN